jgi:hypothetical protein
VVDSYVLVFWWRGSGDGQSPPTRYWNSIRAHIWQPDAVWPPVNATAVPNLDAGALTHSSQPRCVSTPYSRPRPATMPLCHFGSRPRCRLLCNGPRRHRPHAHRECRPPQRKKSQALSETSGDFICQTAQPSSGRPIASAGGKCPLLPSAAGPYPIPWRVGWMQFQSPDPGLDLIWAFR